MNFTYELGNIEIEMDNLQYQKSAFKKSHDLRMKELDDAIDSLSRSQHQPVVTKNTEKLNEINNLLDSI